MSTNEQTARAMQADAIAIRAELKMSRRQLADRLGMKEARVWYLEQTEGTDFKTEHNQNDMTRMHMELSAAKRAGWTRPTMRTLEQGRQAQRPQVVLSNTAVEVGRAKAEAAQLRKLLAKVSDQAWAEAEAAKNAKKSPKAFNAIAEAIQEGLALIYDEDEDPRESEAKGVVAELVPDEDPMA